MKQTQVIFWFLFPSCQDTSEAVHPTVSPFHYPTSSFETGLPFDRLSFLTACFYVSRIAKLLYQITHRVIIIAFVQTHTLRFSLASLRTLYRDTLQRSFGQLAIMPIRPSNRQANRHAAGFSKQTSFYAFFGPIRRVWARFFPHLMELWSWPRPWIAKTNRCLSIRRSFPRPFPRVYETPRPLSTPENDHGPYCWGKSRWRSGRSTDSRYVTQRKCHPCTCDPRLAVGRHQNDACSCAWARAAQSFSITHLKYDTYSFFFACSSVNPFKGTIAFEYIGNSRVIRIGS